MTPSPSDIYEFGDFRLDASKRLVSRRCGEPVPLTPRVFDTLLYLVQHSGAVLDKERLMEAVWPDSIVEENNLSQNISSLRRILGESPGSHRYIVTVPGRGYRFVAEVRVPETATKPQNGSRDDDSTRAIPEALPDGPPAAVKRNGWLPGPPPTHSPVRRNLRPVLLSTLAVLALGGAIFLFWRSQSQTPANNQSRPTFAISEKSIAVLPFDNLTHDPENAYFADGIKDEILTRLSKIAALKVISRTSTQKFKSAPDNVREIARQLGVANILEGSVQKSGETVRVTVQLIHAPSDTHLWAETYDRKLTDMFQVESEVAQRIATALATTLSVSEKRALTAKPTANVEAYQAYLKGRYFWNKRTGEGFAKAAESFQRATAIDPNYAPAYAGLSDVYQFSAIFDVASRTQDYAKAREAAKRALELDETLAEPHASLGLIAMNYDWDWETAEREFRQASELNPNYATAHHWYAEFLVAVGRFDESLAEIKRARELDPLSLIINTDMGKVLYYSRRYDEAIAQLQETLRMDPDFHDAHIWLGSVYAKTGHYPEAISEFNKVRDNGWVLGWLGYVYGVSGRRDEAKKVVNQLSQIETERPIDPSVMVCVYAGLGEKDAAFAAFEKEYEMRSVGMTSLKVNPWYDSLRSDPRFTDLLRRMNLAPP
jgi:TolB-like protein/DNA-binding winged helix-turn-helix (wHTH) protein/predicted negative regulator of RcsB-dependent stress response